jgi:hypothetical protein
MGFNSGFKGLMVSQYLIGIALERGDYDVTQQ